jgi:hypothetical protein
MSVVRFGPPDVQSQTPSDPLQASQGGANSQQDNEEREECNTTDGARTETGERPEQLVYEEPVLYFLDSDVAVSKAHCKLSKKDLARNVAGTVVSSALGAGLAAAGGATAAVVLKGAAPLAKVLGTEVFFKGGPVKALNYKLGVGVPMPKLWKCVEYLGYLHLRNECVVPKVSSRVDKQQNKVREVKLEDPGKKRLGTDREQAKATAESFCSVWSTLSWTADQPVNAVRIIIVPTTDAMQTARVGYEAQGHVTTRLEIDKTQSTNRLLFHIRASSYVLDVNKRRKLAAYKEVRVPVLPLDRVVYVWCGYRPEQTTWHVTCKDAKPVSLLPKLDVGKTYALARDFDWEAAAAHHTGHFGVVNPDVPVARPEVERARVYVDGSYGKGANPPKGGLFTAIKNVAKTQSGYNKIKSLFVAPGAAADNELRNAVLLASKVNEHGQNEDPRTVQKFSGQSLNNEAHVTYV